ncbi:PAS domain S-box protein, partial [bacterium]|nr:PAS domain S-box protein [bacterium]
ITKLTKYGKKVTANNEMLEVEELSFSHRDNVFSFEFASLCYNLPERNQYAYKMEGFNDEWVYSGARRYAIFTNLNPGNYVFRAKGTNSDGVWNEEGTSVKVVIVPPFWQTLWFKIFSIVGTVLIVLLLYRMRINSINQMNKKLEKDVRSKTVELRKEVSEHKASEKKYRVLTENLKEIVFTIDKNMRITYINSSAYTLLGCEPDEVINRQISDILTPESFEKIINILQNKLNKKYLDIRDNSNSQPIEVEFCRKDELKILTEVGFSFLLNTDNEIVSILGVARDITERKESERAKEKLMRRIQRSERLAATGRIASSIAHEINNPLQTVEVNLKMMEEDIENDAINKETLTETLEIFKICAGKIHNTVSQLFNIHRKKTNVKEKVDVNKVILSTLSLLGVQLERKKIKVETNLCNGTAKVNAIEQELFQVFMNIILNARDAVDTRGIIKINTEVKDKHCYIHFQDNGTGISDENIERIYDPFFTTKSEMLGTGLGLSISRRIIESFKGRIRVESKVGEGTLFTIILQTAKK